MSDFIKGPSEAPDRDLALADAAAHRDGLVNSPHFLKMLVDNMRVGLAQCEPRLTPDGGSAVGVGIDLVLIDRKKVVNVKYTVTLQVAMTEEAIIEPPDTGLVVPGDTSISSLLEPKPKIH